MLAREVTTQGQVSHRARSLGSLLGMVALEDQGDGVRDHPLPCVQAHPTVLPRDTKQQVCGQKQASTDKGMAVTDTGWQLGYPEPLLYPDTLEHPVKETQ